MGCLLLGIIFVAFPMAEFHVMMKVAAHIGFWHTVGLFILSAVLGTHFAKHQGLIVMTRMQACLAEGRAPTREMLDGLLVFLGGVLFVLPGFISDALGLILVFPLTRALVRMALIKGFKGKFTAAPNRAGRVDPVPRPIRANVDRGNVEDAEVVD